LQYGQAMKIALLPQQNHRKEKEGTVQFMGKKVYFDDRSLLHKPQFATLNSFQGFITY